MFTVFVTSLSNVWTLCPISTQSLTDRNKSNFMRKCICQYTENSVAKENVSRANIKNSTKMYVLRMPQIYRNLIFMQLNRVTMLNISSSKATWKIGWGIKGLMDGV